MYKIFTYFLFFISFWVISQRNFIEVQYEDKDFVLLDRAYEDLLKDLHAELVLHNEDCIFIETCKNTKIRNLGEVLFQKRATKLYQASTKGQPFYPRKAQERGIEGYVILGFDIEIDGSTSNHYVIEGKCISNRVYPYQDCNMFDSAALKAARKNRYVLNTPQRIADIPHKYTFSLEGSDLARVFINIPQREFRQAEDFVSNKEWANLEKLVESFDDNYIKFYWLGLALENQNDLNSALQNYIKSLSFQGDPKVINELRNRILSLLYRMNNFKAYSYICDETHTFYDNYMCGMNMLQIGDSIGGVPYLLNSYRKNLIDNDFNQRIAEIIESQRNWIKEDLIKMQSSP